MKMNIMIRYGVFLLSFMNMYTQTKTENTGSSDLSKYTIENCINKFSLGENNKVEKTIAGYQYWFVDPNLADGKTLKMSVVTPHSATHPPHVHAEDEFFFILEGHAELYFKGRWIPVEPYTSFYCPPNVEHGIRNAGGTEMKYLVIKEYEKLNPVRIEFMKKQGGIKNR
jgi:mannose-6-phosphate isomerase-like protein (cupin superfamily)